MAEVSVRTVVAAMESMYPPGLAADWDAIGLAVGDPDAPVRRILFALDPVMSTVDEAIDLGADLVITHHPLLLHPVHSVATSTAKGAVIHRLITHGIALFTAHTNADHANPGVSDVLADLLGIRRTRPIESLAADPTRLGTGRVGELAADVTLEQFAEHIATVLPWTAHGVRVAGDPQATVRTVAVCGGAGDSLLHSAAQVADVYVTSDLRHHRAQDHRAEGGCALIDVAHWAAEAPWLDDAAARLRVELERQGSSVATHVSRTPTDPWTIHRGSAP